MHDTEAAVVDQHRRGELIGMTGIDAPYGAPEEPDLVIESGEEAVEASLEKPLRFVGGKLASEQS